MVKHTILALTCCAAAGCASGNLPEVVKVPVPVSCLTSAPPEKPATLSEGEILALDDYTATLTVYAERLTLKGYAEKASALLQACK